jgi:probable HAF family extracellular repeat protein
MSNLNRLAKLVLFISAMLALPVSAPAITTTGQYTVTILGRVQHNYPNSAFNAACINDSGIVAGSATVRVPDNPSQALRGILWQSSVPHYTILGTISELNGYDSLATWINDSGIAVGRSSENTSHGFVYVPVMFTPNGIVDLGVKNAVSGIATCINDKSQVVGNLYFDIPVTAYQAFLYQNGVMTPLGYPMPTIGYSIAVAINNSGLIVGSAQFAVSASPHAACYVNGAWMDLGTLGSGSNFRSAATSVNDSGTIVGTWGNTNEGGLFIYQNGQMTSLGPAPGQGGNPFINNAGQIVQGNYTYQNGVWKDLNDLDLGDGWTFSEAFGINNEGAIIGIVFREVNRTFLYRSALLTPVTASPQPVTHTP